MPELAAIVRAAVAAHHLLSPAKRYLVALSGGGDSVALLAILQEMGLPIEAAHCNFHLRGAESDGDEAFCRNICAAREVKLHVRHFQTAAEARKNGESIEMAARRLRYDWFSRLCADRRCEAVCVAHHRNDNIETLLLNLVRGTGIHGLTGMAYRRGNVIRPLLDATRNDILNYLKTNGLRFVTDSSNADTRYKRNLVRHELLPLLRRLNPSVEETLLGDMLKLQAAEEAYDSIGNAVLQQAMATPHGVRFALNGLKYKAQFDAIGRAYGFPAETMRAICQNRGMNERARYDAPLYLAAIYRGWLEVVKRPNTFSPVTLPAEGETFTPDGQRIGLRLMSRDELEVIPRDTRTAAIDADNICGALHYRAAAAGDRFRPFGMKGSKLVSDFLTDRHCSRLERMWAGVVCDDNGILWLCGHRPDRRAAITSDTTRVLLITCHDWPQQSPEKKIL